MRGVHKGTRCQNHQSRNNTGAAVPKRSAVRSQWVSGLLPAMRAVSTKPDQMAMVAAA